METQKLWKAAIYIRISRGDNTDTLESQRNIIAEYLNRFDDIQICSIKVDDGYSGLNINRPAFQEMLQDIQNGNINCVVVRDLSRLSRDCIDAARYIRRIFPHSGVRFISVLERLDITDEMGMNTFLLISLKNVLNEEYLRQLSRNTKISLHAGYLEGKYMGSIPAYGYRKASVDRHKLEVDSQAAEVVRMIFQWKLEGMSAAGISDILNQTGILSPEEYIKSNLNKSINDSKTKKRAKWFPNTIIRILSNRVYLGRLEQGKTEKPYFKSSLRLKKAENKWCCVEHAHQPIIEQQTFEAVDRLLKMDTRIAPGKNMLMAYSGFVRCSNCGRNMIQRQIVRNNHIYYYYACCSGVRKATKCAGYRISKLVLEQQIFEQIKNHIDAVIFTRDMIPKMNAATIQEPYLEKALKTVQVLEAHLHNNQQLLEGLDDREIVVLMTEYERARLKSSYMKKCHRFEKCILATRKKIDMMTSGEYLFGWINTYMPFIPFEIATRTFMALFVRKIIVDKNKEVRIIFLNENKLRLLRTHLENFCNSDNIVAEKTPTNGEFFLTM